MPEANEKVETFNPELIKKEGDELKKAYFEATQDINKIKSQHKEEIENLNKKFDEFKFNFESQNKEKENKELDKLEEEGKIKDLNEKYKNKLKEIEAQNKEIQALLDRYKEKEAIELKQKELKKKELLETLPEEDREDLKELPFETLQKVIAKLGTITEKKDPLIKEGSKTKEIPSDKDLMPTELLNRTPIDEVKDTLMNLGILDK